MYKYLYILVVNLQQPCPLDGEVHLKYESRKPSLVHNSYILVGNVNTQQSYQTVDV